MHYVGYFPFFLKLWLSPSFDADHKFKMAIFLDENNPSPFCIDWHHFSPEIFLGAELRLSRRIETLFAPWLTNSSSVWVRHWFCFSSLIFMPITRQGDLIAMCLFNTWLLHLIRGALLCFYCNMCLRKPHMFWEESCTKWLLPWGRKTIWKDFKLTEKKPLTKKILIASVFLTWLTNIHLWVLCL